LVAVALGACTGGVGQNASPTPPHVFVIVMENKSYEQALSGGFTASLASRYGLATNYHAITHPSVPNYLAMTSGQTWAVTDDSHHVLPNRDLGSQLTEAGVTWRAYMEGLGPAGCLDSPPPYDPGHNPFVFYGGQCPPNVVPFTELASDLAGEPSQFIWITPDDCHNTHNCPVSDGDVWLRETVHLIMSSNAWKTGGILFITWDEDDGSSRDNRILTLVVTPTLGHRVSSLAYDHYSLLATIEDLLGVARLANARDARTMDDLVR
jgi:hypothetical protein